MVGISRTTSTLNTMITRKAQANDLQAQLARASEEVATGVKSNIYRSLGLRAAETLALRARMDRNEAFIASNTLLTNRLEITAASLSTIRATAQQFLELAIPNRDSPTGFAAELQAAAKRTLEQLTAQINVTYQGDSIFAGIDSSRAPLQSWEKVNTTSGLSPRQVLEDVVGSGLSSAADATAKIAEVQAIFNSSDLAQPNRNFEATFYNGTALLDASGVPASRLQVRIEEGVALNFGVQANDEAFTETLRGIAMLAGTDVTQITSSEAYTNWVGSAVEGLTRGIAGLLNAEATLGAQQKSLETMVESQRRIGDIYNSRVLALEGVDLYEAASRVSLLQAQLEATYTVTARLRQLSFLNFM